MHRFAFLVWIKWRPYFQVKLSFIFSISKLLLYVWIITAFWWQNILVVLTFSRLLPIPLLEAEVCWSFYIFEICIIQASSFASIFWIFKWMCDWQGLHKNKSNSAVIPPLLFFYFLLPVTSNCCLVLALFSHFPLFCQNRLCNRKIWSHACPRD